MIDIIICTYNRPEKVQKLIFALLDCIPCTSLVIVVDSSEKENQTLQNLGHVKYIRSTHKNQPYQRYLGFSYSKSEILLFLDDDMELISNNIFDDIRSIFNDNDIVGLAINFKDKQLENLLSKVPVSINKNSNNLVSNLIRKVSFNSIPDVGQIGLFGLRGEQPNHLEETTIISGGAFAARKSAIFQNFNFQLLDLFEQKMGMGEDTLIGYGLSKKGKVLFYKNLCFLHNDNTGSNYSLDLFSYSKRVIFSRFYIASELTRLDKKPSLTIRLKYIWYGLFRIFGATFSTMLKPGKKKNIVLRGLISGFFISFNFTHRNWKKRNDFWLNELENNSQKTTS